MFFVIYLKQIFLGTREQFGGTAPECPPWLQACCKRSVGGPCSVCKICICSKIHTRCTFFQGVY